MMSRRAVAAVPLGSPATRGRIADWRKRIRARPRFAGPLASRRTAMASVMATIVVILSAPVLVFAQGAAVKEAERLAAEAIATAGTRPDAALASARRALALTAEFQPTSFIRA